MSPPISWGKPAHTESEMELSKAEQTLLERQSSGHPSSWGVLYQQGFLDLPALRKPENSLSVPANLRLLSLTFISKTPERHGEASTSPHRSKLPKVVSFDRWSPKSF